MDEEAGGIEVEIRPMGGPQLKMDYPILKAVAMRLGMRRENLAEA